TEAHPTTRCTSPSISSSATCARQLRRDPTDPARHQPLPLMRPRARNRGSPGVRAGGPGRRGAARWRAGPDPRRRGGYGLPARPAHRRGAFLIWATVGGQAAARADPAWCRTAPRYPHAVTAGPWSIEDLVGPAGVPADRNRALVDDGLRHTMPDGRVGTTVNLAARVAAATESDQFLVHGGAERRPERHRRALRPARRTHPERTGRSPRSRRGAEGTPRRHHHGVLPPPSTLRTRN